ncbi:MAG TPA: PAS domain S-box protein [Gemmataceae bacterium]|nr:PAS domain S-box protein [Gemmataceae bacterium]
MAAVMQNTQSSIDSGSDGWARALFDGMSDAVFIHDLEGHILQANAACCRQLGFTHDEMLHLKTHDVDDPSFAAGFADRVGQQTLRGQLRIEGRHRTKNGAIIPVDVNTSVIYYNGQPAVLAIMRDITERQAMEKALRQQKDQLQSILETMSDAVIVADDKGQFLVCNPAARKHFGLPENPVKLPQHGHDLQMFQADGVTPCPVSQFPLALAIRGETVDQAEIFVRHPLAAEGRWLSVSGRPMLDSKTGARGGLVVCRDISNRKRTEARQVTQLAVTRALDESADLERNGPTILRHICDGLGWDVGTLWLVDTASMVLHCRAVWHRPDKPAQEFIEQTQRMTSAPGKGLPGRVWITQQSTFIPDITLDSGFLRIAQARKAGLKAGFAFPIRSGGETIGVVELFQRRQEKPDAALLALTATIGSQIGQALERQRVEKALRDSEAFYHALVESLPQNIYRKDRDGRITFANRHYCTTLNKPLHELLGKTDFDLFPSKLAEKYLEDDRKVMDTGNIFETIEEHQRPDGSNIYVQVVKLPVWDSRGKAIGTQGIFWDVTERKRAEEMIAKSERRYRQFTEATQDGIVVADQVGRITLFNPAAERLFGYQAADVVGKTLDILVPPELKGQHRVGFERYLATRQSKIIGRPVELQGIRKDGTIFPLEVALSVLDVGGGQIQFLGTIRDLTERNRMRAFLVQNEKLTSIGLLSAGVAHEINNPLAFVANNLVVLERDGKGLMDLLDLFHQQTPRLAEIAPEDAAKIAQLEEEIDLPYLRENITRLLSRTREGVDRVTRIVRSLRGLARTDNAKRLDTDLPPVVEASLEILRGRVKSHNVEVVTNYDPNSTVSCVQTQISQVLLNLLVNAEQAIEATGRTEGGCITITTKRLADEMLIEVGDNGTGIDPEYMPKLYDPFFTTKEVGEGTGLGLSIVHNIIRAHGGRIEVDSQLGAGTCFRVYLPLQPS